MRAQQDRFDEWVSAGLLQAETAARLRDYEAARALPPEQHPEPLSHAPAQPHRALALVGEILGYLGAILTITAISFIAGQTWAQIPVAGRVALVATLTAIVAVAGVLASRSLQDAGQRLASALLVATVVCFGWLAWVSVDAARVQDEVAGLWTFSVAAIAAGMIYAFRRRALAQLALLAGCVGVAAMTIEVLDATEGAVPGIVIGSIGAAWVALAILKVLTPQAPALVAGGLVMLFGVNTIVFDESTRGLTLAVGVALAVAMLALAIMRRELILLMIPGAIGLLTLVPQLIEHFVGSAIATWAGILVTGVILVVVAVRLLRTSRTPRAPLTGEDP